MNFDRESGTFSTPNEVGNIKDEAAGMMRTTLAIAALGLLIAGCGGSPRHKPPDTPEYHAIQDYLRIGRSANLLLSTDRINWVPGRTDPERVSVECKGLYCSVGYSAYIRANKVYSLVPEEITILADTNGINTGIDFFINDSNDLHSYAGWMEYSFFASTVVLFKSDIDPDQGVTQTYGTINGSITKTNPVTEATWTGFATARDHNIATDIKSVVVGDASISVRIDDEVLADVRLTGLANTATGQAYDDMIFEGMSVTDGQFSRYHADDNRLSGAFYGPGHEEAGGVFDHPQGLVGAYGGRRMQ